MPQEPHEFNEFHEPHEFGEMFKEPEPKKGSLPLYPAFDPIPYLFWNMFALAREIEKLKESLNVNHEEDEGGCPFAEQGEVMEDIPIIIRRALSRRADELGPIPEGAAESVPWDEFYIWLDNESLES